MNIHYYNQNELKFLKKDNQKNTAVILLHGYGASMYDLFELNQCSQQFDWYFPQGIREVHGGLGYSWFPIDEQALQSAMMQGTYRNLTNYHPEGIENCVDLLIRFIDDLPHSNIILGGFSQGAMLTAHLACHLLEKLKALTFFSGNIVAGQLLESKIQDSKIPIFQSHGQNDPILSLQGAKDLAETFSRRGYKVEFHAFDGQHEIPSRIFEKWAQFMQLLAETGENSSSQS